MVNFGKDLRENTVATLERYKVHYKDKDDLNTLLIRLYTFWEKYILPRKRVVLISEELAAQLGSFPESVTVAVDKMREWIENGVDINCFQGRGLYGKGNRDYQNMLYGIVHLHLSADKDDLVPIIKKNGFAKPGSYLLYAYFNKTHAYFIKVQEHPKAFEQDGSIAIEWISKHLLSIVKHNWPELLDSKKIDGMTLCDGDGNPISLDDKALSHLLSNNINTGIDLEGSLYWPGLGVTNSGDSAWAVIKANQMVNKVVVVQWNFIRNRERIIKCFKDILSRNNRAIPPVFDIHYDYIPALDQFLVIDRISGAAYDYSGNRCVLFKKMDRTAS